jgi:PAS domain S-box-containing protein
MESSRNMKGGGIMDQRYETIIEDYLDPLEEYEQLFQTVFERTDEGIFVSEADVEGRIIEANAAVAAMHGYSIEEFVKLRASDLHPAKSLESAKEGIQKMLEGGWVEVEHEHIRKDGTKFPVRYRAGVTQYLGRRVIISFVRDITPERQAEEALRQCERDLATRI